MSLRYNILPEHRLVYIRLAGQDSFDDLSSRLLAIPRQDDRFKMGMNTILDGSDAIPVDQPMAEKPEYSAFVDKVTDTEEYPEQRKLAIITGDKLSFGLARMRGAPLQGSLLEPGVFNSLRDALQWLKLPGEVDLEIASMPLLEIDTLP